MFSINELREFLQKTDFARDYLWVKQALVNKRAGQSVSYEFKKIKRLDFFVECVLASTDKWSYDEAMAICRTAAEIAEIISDCNIFIESERRLFRLKSFMLYELAGYSALSQSMIAERDFDNLIEGFLKRLKGFDKLNSNFNSDLNFHTDKIHIHPLIDPVIRQDAIDLLLFEQGKELEYKEVNYLSLIGDLSKHFYLPLNSSELKTLSLVIKKRAKLATVANVSSELFSSLKQIQFPLELWPAQLKALNAGLLDDKYDSWGLASPTGTGKTFLTRLLIIDALQKNPQNKILYLVPSRALVYEVSYTLQKALEAAKIEVLALNPQLVDLNSEEENKLKEASIAVLTPEKADLLIRLGASTLQTITHVIVDEAHHIESDTRGVLLELYLWRIKKLIKANVRFIFLSAVAPNIQELTEWIGSNPKSEIILNRATRLRAGVYKYIKKDDGHFEGWINYSDETSIRVVEKVDKSTLRKALVQLVEKIHVSGPVLIVTKGKSECENLARELQIRLEKNNTLKELSPRELESTEYNRLDSRLEREMYANVPMRKFILNRIAYHHAVCHRG